MNRHPSTTERAGIISVERNSAHTALNRDRKAKNLRPIHPSVRAPTAVAKSLDLCSINSEDPVTDEAARELLEEHNIAGKRLTHERDDCDKVTVAANERLHAHAVEGDSHGDRGAIRSKLKPLSNRKRLCLHLH